MTARVAIYARSSQDNGDDTFSISSQVKRCKEYAAKQGFHVPDELVFFDEYTGTTLERPAFSQIQRLIHNGQIDVLIVHKVSRIARKSHLAGFFLDVCFTTGVALHVYEWGRAVENNSLDLMMFNFQATISQIERNEIVERTTRGRRDKAESNVWLGQGTAPYGYHIVGRGKHTTVSIEEDEAAIVRFIYDAYINQRLSATHIGQYLNATNVPTPAKARARVWQLAKHRGWQDHTIIRILRDSRYVGEWYSFRYATSGLTGNRQKEHVAKEEQIKHNFEHLAVVDRDTWQQTQEQLNERAGKHLFTAKNFYLLSRRLTCYCGYTVTASTNNGKSWYVCRARREQNRGYFCDMPTIRARDVERRVWDEVERFIKNPQMTIDMLTQAQTNQREEHKEAVMDLDALQKIRAGYETRLAELYAEYKEGLLSKKLYADQKSALDKNLATAEELYAEYQETLNSHVLSDKEIKQVVKQCQTLGDMLDELGSLEQEQQRGIVDAMDVRGTFRATQGHLWLDLFIHRVPFAALSIGEAPPNAPESSPPFSPSESDSGFSQDSVLKNGRP